MKNREEQIAALKKLQQELLAEMPFGLFRDKEGKLMPPITYPNIVEAEKKLLLRQINYN